MAFLAFAWLFAALAAPLPVEAAESGGLEYDSNSGSMVPLPPAERLLAAAHAEHFIQVDKAAHTLEGARFANDGSFYFCDVSANRIYRLDPAKRELKPVAEFADFSPTGLAFHPDGRLFFCGHNADRTKGEIYAMNPDGTNQKLVLSHEAGFQPNDLVFNAAGGIYFTDFKGDMTHPAGGVYYITPDFGEVKPVIANIANANGVALSPDGRTLWIGDYGRGILYRVALEGDTGFNRIHSTPVYYFTGRGPDSMRTDSDGNLYVAVMSQGRVLVFNPRGLPIGQILLPGRDDGKNLYVASLDIKPDSKDIFMVARDDEGAGANIFRSLAYAQGKADGAVK